MTGAERPGDEWWLRPSGPNAAGQPPESADAGTSADQPPSRPLWKRFRVSIILVLIALGLLVVTLDLYPSTQELPTPVYASLTVASLRPIGLIQYSVYQVSPATAKIDVMVELPAGAAVPPANVPVARFVVFPPIGISFTTCPHPACESESHSISSWNVPLVFRGISGPNGVTGTAFADFLVRGHSFGETYNRVNAAAAIPEVTYSGSGTPTFETQYQMPDASSYDWSGFPVQFANATFATWTQQVSGGLLAGRDAVGTDYVNQSRDSFDTFLAGVILGLVGGALLSAIQEAFHANDKA